MKLLQMGGLALVGLALVGCANRSYVVLLEDPDGGVGQVTVSGKRGMQTIGKALHGAPLDGSAPALAVDARQFEADFAAVLAAQPVLPRRYLLYFQSGGAELTPESEALLATILEDVQHRPVADVSVIGHTDTVGRADANEALGLKRAQGIAEMLTQRGLQAFALAVESHGERNPLVPTPDETDEPLNRRVEISVR